MSPLNDEEARTLLERARRSLKHAVLGRGLPDESQGPGGPAASGALAEPRGAFVTLHRRGELRGCIGHIEADRPLVETVAECAGSAALHDPRFPAVTPAELAEINIEVSVLSPLVDILPEAIEIGRHGLLISRHFRRGLLLPQVPVQWHWDRERFLEETCRKAGFAADAWRHGARIQAFSTQVIAEPEEAQAAASQPLREHTSR